MSWSVLKDQVASLVENISTIQEVASYPKIKFEGYPAAYVVPSDNDADYETTSENIRTYAFLIRVFYETKQTGIESAIDSLLGIVDSVVDACDQEDLKSAANRTLGVSLPSNYTFINVFASPAEWNEILGENLIMAEIRLKIRVSIDVS